VIDEHGGNFGGVATTVGIGSGCFSGKFSRGDGGGRVAFVGCCLSGFSKGDGGGWSCSRAMMGSGSLHGGGAVVLGSDGSAGLICGGVVDFGSCSGGFSNETDENRT
jgi:hypothetical protein